MYFVVPDYVHTIFKGENMFHSNYYCNVIRPKCNVHTYLLGVQRMQY